MTNVPELSRIDAGSARSERLQVLLLDYEMARDDERTGLATQATTFSIGVALLAVLMPVVSQTCSFSDKGSCIEVPDLVIAAAPMGPLAILAFMQMLGIAGTLRSYYTRALEIELRGFAPDELRAIPGVPPASFGDISMGAMSLSRGRVAYRALFFVLIAAVISIFGGLTVYIAMHVNIWVRVGMAVLYGGCGLLIFTEALRASVSGRGLFVDLIRNRIRLTTRQRFPTFEDQVPARERSLTSYLVLPRPEDTVKWLFFPASFLISAWSIGTLTPSRIVEALVVLGILEYLLYEGRYQWNDMIGLVRDQNHPGQRAGRLPVGHAASDARRNVFISQCVMIVRVLLALLLGLWCWDGLGVTVVVLIVSVFGVAAIYEVLRSMTESQSPLAPTWIAKAVSITVGFGYVIRGVSGLVVAGLSPLSLPVALAVICFAAFGTMFVTLTWVLEATSHCYGSIPGEIQYSSELTHKIHVGSLLHYLPISGTPLTGGARGGQCDSLEVLLEPGRVDSPWNVSLVISMGTGGGLGVALANSGSLAGVGAAAVCAVAIGFGCGIALATAGSQFRRWLIVGIGTALLIIVGAVAKLRVPLLCGVPVLLFSAWYAMFRTQAFQSLKHPIAPAVATLKGLSLTISKFLMGQETREFLGFGAKGHNRQRSGADR